MASAQPNPMKGLYERLGKLGVTRAYARKTLLPSWWNDDAARTSAGYAEAVSYVSKRLGVSPKQLRGESPVALQAPSMRTKFKLRVGSAESDVALAQNLSCNVARHVLAVTRPGTRSLPTNSRDIREAILSSGNPFVSFDALVAYLWQCGIPVIHTDGFPANARKMDALAVNIDGRAAIVLSRSSPSSAWMLFVLAHEVGHVACGHVAKDEVLLDEKIDEDIQSDEQEVAANAFASRLLRGDPPADFSTVDTVPDALTLAAAAKVFGSRKQIDPGHLILSYGHTMSRTRGRSFFPLAQAALKHVETGSPAQAVISKQMTANANLAELSEENAEFVRAMTT